MSWITILIIVGVIVALVLMRQMGFVNPQHARQLLGQGAKVVDVRSPSEYASGHLPGALNIPLSELSGQAERLLPNKTQPVLLHCLSGARSGMAQRQLARAGYSNVYNLGGYARAKKILAAAQ